MAAEKNGFGSALRVGGGTLTLLGIYLITNLDLLRTLTGEGFTTHRQEMVLRAAEHPLTSFWELIFSGGSYSPVYSAGILAAAALLAPAVLAMYSRSGRKTPENRTQGAAGKMLRRRSGKLGTNVPNTYLRNGVDKAPDMGGRSKFSSRLGLDWPDFLRRSAGSALEQQTHSIFASVHRGHGDLFPGGPDLLVLPLSVDAGVGSAAGEHLQAGGPAMD